MNNTIQLDGSTKTGQAGFFFSTKPVWRWFILGVIFITSLAIRLYGVFDLPLDFHPTRQYRSAIISRAFYYKTQDSIPEWQKAVADSSAEKEGILEPPIMELAAALAYIVVGGEYLWIPKLLSSVVWVMGGTILYLIGNKLGRADTAAISTAFYLFLPFGVVASSSFQPDPLMILMFLLSILMILRYYEQPQRQRLLLAGIISATAVLIKPVCFFAIVGVFFSLALYSDGRQLLRNRSKIILFLTITLIPSILYYAYGIFVAGFLRDQAQASFVPELMLQFRFWDGWLKRIRLVMGFTYFIGGLLGLLLAQTRKMRFLLAGLWFGYFSFCFVFNYHIQSHDYYHLQLIPIVALSLMSIITPILDRLYCVGTNRLSQLAIMGLLFSALFLGAGTSVQSQRKLPDFEPEVALAMTIGQMVSHSTETVMLAPYYGKPLEYYGEFSGEYWPDRSDIRDAELWDSQVLDVRERFNLLNSNDSLEYFVVTDLPEFENQADLKRFLTDEFSVMVENDAYIIFDLQNGIR